jgi:adenosylmethionine-8-amino-7-oxononanoate aminotransferase
LTELLAFEIVGDVRGKGLMCGFELVKDKATKEPFPPASKVSLRFQDEAMRRGLVLFQCTGCVEGTSGDMVLVTPPLIITTEQVDEMIAILKETTRVMQHELLG